MMYKEDALRLAVEIAKEAAKSGNNAPQIILEASYKKIVELAQDANKE